MRRKSEEKMKGAPQCSRDDRKMSQPQLKRQRQLNLRLVMNWIPTHQAVKRREQKSHDALPEETQAMSTWDCLCWRMGKLGGVGVDSKFE